MSEKCDELLSELSALCEKHISADEDNQQSFCNDSVLETLLSLLKRCSYFGGFTEPRIWRSPKEQSFNDAFAQETNDGELLLKVLNVIKIFLNCKPSKLRKQKVQCLVKNELFWETLLDLELKLSGNVSNEALIETFYMVVGKLSYYDKHFGEVLQSQNSKSLIQPVNQLQVCYLKGNGITAAVLSYLKQITECPKNAWILMDKTAGEMNRNGIFMCLFAIVGSYKLVSYSCIYALEIIASLCKNKRGTVELVNSSTNYLFILTKYLQETLENLEKKKLAFRSLRAMNAILCTFLNLGFVKSGREAMKTFGVNDVILSFMKAFFNHKINSKYCERITMLCSLAIQRCLPPLQLPLTTFNPYAFSLPSKRSKSEGSIPENGAEKLEESSNDESNPGSGGKQKREDYFSGRSNASSDSSEKSDYEFFSNSECSRNNSSEDESCDDEMVDENPADVLSYSQYFNELLLFPRIFEYSKEAFKEENNTEKDDSFFKYFLQTSKSRRNSIKRPSESNATPDANFNRVLDVHSVKEDIENAVPVTEEWEELHEFMVKHHAKSVIPFVKIAECMHKEIKGSASLEPLSFTENNLLNKLWFSKLLQHIDNRCDSEKLNFDCIVYDIEGNSKPTAGSLQFESRFENANLRKAIKTGVSEYTLLLNTDVNTSSFGQWFFFEVKSMRKDVEYTFNIINCRKQRSLYREGLRPLLYSKKEFELNNGSWKRVARNVTYYRNHFVDEDSVSCIIHEDPYYTLTFSLTFPHENDTCYLAYNFPYTYSMLLTHLHFWQRSVENTSIYFDKQTICQTLSGNDVPLLTITNKTKENKPQYVFLLARVHPSESPSSWNMKGVIDFLLSNQTEANLLRDKYVFKILPMMNPDGVINGNSRTSLSGDDLNRQWDRPDPLMHPTIYHTKMLLKYISSVSKKMNPVFFCDFHGHSHRSNVFMYGCAPQLSWRKCDRLAFPNDYSCFIAPMLLNGFAPAFNLNYCSFSMDKTRRGTARITVWKEFGVQLSYTMECTHGGCDQGIYRSFHLGIEQLKDMGAYVCKILINLQFRTNAGKMVPQMPESMRNQASELLKQLNDSCSSNSEEEFDEST